MTLFVSFFWGHRTAPRHEVVTAALLLARDRRTTLARNISYVASQTYRDPWTASPQLVRSVIQQREAVELPPEEAWRLPYMAKLLSQLHTLALKDEEARVQLLIDSLCKS